MAYKIAQIKSMENKVTTNLRKLGVNKEDVGSLHRTLSIRHNTEFELVQTKGAAKEALKCGATIIAVNENGGSKGMKQSYSHYGQGTNIRLAGSEACCSDNSLTGAMQSIGGKGWKLYKALPNKTPKRKYYSSASERDHLEDFSNAVNKYEPLIKAEAKIAAKKIKSFLVSTVNDLDNDGEQFVSEKQIYKTAKDMAKKGTEGYDARYGGAIGQARRARAGLIHKYFFAIGAVNDYYSSSVSGHHVRDVMEEDPLAVVRFIKETLHLIRDLPIEYGEVRDDYCTLRFNLEKED
jgi:hypothetical protein